MAAVAGAVVLLRARSPQARPDVLPLQHDARDLEVLPRLAFTGRPCARTTVKASRVTVLRSGVGPNQLPRTALSVVNVVTRAQRDSVAGPAHQVRPSPEGRHVAFFRPRTSSSRTVVSDLLRHDELYDVQTSLGGRSGSERAYRRAVRVASDLASVLQLRASPTEYPEIFLISGSTLPIAPR